jgi:enoyl-CoA hydratase/carnithine racemase
MSATEQAVSEPEAILLRQDDAGVTTLTLNRPDQFNALSEDLLSALQTELHAIATDETVRVVVLAGAGRAFCAGHDLKEMRARPERNYYESLFRQCSRAMLGLLRLPQPVIARVHGIATAAGCQLVATCDLAVAADSARFAVSGINVGLFCSTPAVALSRNLSRKQAMAMLLTGEFVGAKRASELGLVNQVVPAAQLDEAVRALADTILSKSPMAVRLGKEMFYRQLEMGIEDAYGFAGERMACNMMAEDAGEGIDAFMEKRTPTWTGR